MQHAVVYGRTALDCGVAGAPVGTADGSSRAVGGDVVGSEVGVADGDDGSAVAAGPLGVRVRDSDGVGTGDGSDGVVRLVVGGGASGGVGVMGPSGLAKYSGTAMSAAATQVAPSPAAARRRRRRDALRRIAS
ncbi:hypothetical protein ACIBU0_07100 [Streptomyces sp. NPDC049627]|uniref:hypothetical protein n=1 Tax=Streptomyces sp. NPDC049627 TaxID=3365595 RepID=UPI00378DF57C